MNRTLRACACRVVLVACTVSCDARRGDEYKLFVSSQAGIRPGMSIRQVFDAGLADYLMASGGKNVTGGTVPAKQPASPECRRYVVDVHYGGGFAVTVFCNMNGPSDRQVVPQRRFSTKRDLLDGLGSYASWTKSTSFRVESPVLKIGGVYDSYEFTLDEGGKVADVSPVRIATLH